MVNRRGFLTKFLKGAAAAAVIAPTLLLKPRPEPKFEPNVLHDYKPAPPEDLFNHITNIDPIDTPLFAEYKAAKDLREVGRAHEWLTDDQRADLADWIDQPSFSRPAIEAACGKNPSFWPEGSRERITALGAEALKRSAAEPVWPATENIECGSSLALSSSS